MKVVKVATIGIMFMLGLLLAPTNNVNETVSSKWKSGDHCEYAEKAVDFFKESYREAWLIRVKGKTESLIVKGEIVACLQVGTPNKGAAFIWVQVKADKSEIAKFLEEVYFEKSNGEWEIVHMSHRYVWFKTRTGWSWVIAPHK